MIYFVGERYLDILRNLKVNYLDRLPPNEYNEIFFVHDGAPPHNTVIVNQLLHTYFEDRWIGTNGPFRWPPRSPDITPLDFFIWGYLKNEVYRNPVTIKEECEQRVRRAVNSLSPTLISRATNEGVIRRLSKCLEVQGRNFEHLL